jgi:hypothetical protein
MPSLVHKTQLLRLAGNGPILAMIFHIANFQDRGEPFELIQSPLAPCRFPRM